MSWATIHVARLIAGETIQFRPRGQSMRGRIESGQLVTVRPVGNLDSIPVGAIVLCKVGRKYLLHLVKAVRPSHERFLIANNVGHENGWISSKAIFGICVKVEP
jgi:hypothetical protein